MSSRDELLRPPVWLWASLPLAAGLDSMLCFIPELHNRSGIHSGVGHLASVMFWTNAYPWVFRQGPYRIRVYCLGSGAAVVGLLAINVFYQPLPVLL